MGGYRISPEQEHSALLLRAYLQQDLNVPRDPELRDVLLRMIDDLGAAWREEQAAKGAAAENPELGETRVVSAENKRRELQKQLAMFDVEAVLQQPSMNAMVSGQLARAYLLNQSPVPDGDLRQSNFVGLLDGIAEDLFKGTPSDQIRAEAMAIHLHLSTALAEILKAVIVGDTARQLLLGEPNRVTGTVAPEILEALERKVRQINADFVGKNPAWALEHKTFPVTKVVAKLDSDDRKKMIIQVTVMGIETTAPRVTARLDRVEDVSGLIRGLVQEAL